jgi:hypothetical protein
MSADVLACLRSAYGIVLSNAGVRTISSEVEDEDDVAQWYAAICSHSLKGVCAQTLPWPKEVKDTRALQGDKLFLQVVEVHDTTQSRMSHDRGAGGNRMLDLLLSDGHSRFHAVEYKSCPALKAKNLLPGTKVVLRGPIPMRNKVLLLSPGVIAVPGVGGVASLAEAHRMKSAQKTGVGGLAEGELPPPKFVPLDVEAAKQRAIVRKREGKHITTKADKPGRQTDGSSSSRSIASKRSRPRDKNSGKNRGAPAAVSVSAERQILSTKLEQQKKRLNSAAKEFIPPGDTKGRLSSSAAEFTPFPSSSSSSSMTTTPSNPLATVSHRYVKKVDLCPPAKSRPVFSLVFTLAEGADASGDVVKASAGLQLFVAEFDLQASNHATLLKEVKGMMKTKQGQKKHKERWRSLQERIQKKMVYVELLDGPPEPRDLKSEYTLESFSMNVEPVIPTPSPVCDTPPRRTAAPRATVQSSAAAAPKQQRQGAKATRAAEFESGPSKAAGSFLDFLQKGQ